VRADLFGAPKATIGRALMFDLPADAGCAPESVEQRYRFDFRCVDRDVAGYAWAFPCLIDGRPHVNVGIYEQHPHHWSGGRGVQQRMVEALDAAFPEFCLARRPRSAQGFKSFPIRWFDGRPQLARGRTILAGDAAGVDPLMGEGISYAFEHARLAAPAIAGFLDGDDGALDRYSRAVSDGAIGRKLRKLAFAARRFYGSRHRIYFRLAGANRRAQEIGVDWYNGAAHLDESPVRVLVWKWLRSVLFARDLR
jgi:flavin-dependent dehydrogenase